VSQPYFQKYGIKDSARSLFAGSVYNDLIVGLDFTGASGHGWLA
jgi:hypothetical protein